MKRVCFVCPDLWHLTKEKKYSTPVVGFLYKTQMLGTAIWEYIAYGLRRTKLARSVLGKNPTG